MYRVLLIEDDIVVRENTAELLELSNYQITTSPNGRIGISTAITLLPDIILCDIMMPEMDGYNVLEALSNNPETRHIPFIFISAKTEHKDIRKGMDMGADDYLTKPFEEDELLSAIESRLAKAAILNEEREKHPTDESTMLHTLNDLKNYFDDNGTEFIFSKGDQIFSQGSHPNFVYLIAKGTIKCYECEESGKELTTALYKEDDLFGYIAILHGTNRQVNAMAMENCKLMGISKETFLKLIKDNHKLNHEIISLLVENIEETRHQLLQMAYASVRKKTAATILQFTDKMNKTADSFIRISRNDLASVAGIATESLIRTLSSFQKEGLIDIEGRNIKIIEIEKLKKIN